MIDSKQVHEAYLKTSILDDWTCTSASTYQIVSMQNIHLFKVVEKVLRKASVVTSWSDAALVYDGKKKKRKNKTPPIPHTCEDKSEQTHMSVNLK